MRWYYVAYGIFLFVAIIDFAVTAPVPVAWKPLADVHVVHKTEPPKTNLGKRGDEEGLLFKLIGYPESHSPASHPLSSSLPISANDVLNNLWVNVYGHPDKPLATHSSWGSLPPLPSHDWMDVGQPVSAVHNEPSQARPGQAPPVPDNAASDNRWPNVPVINVPDRSLTTSPSSSGPAHDWMDAGQPVPSMTNEPSQVASPDHSPPVPANDALNNLWLKLYGEPFSDKSLATPPSSSGSAHGWKDAGQPVPSMTNEPSQAASPDHSPPVPANSALNNLWLKLYGEPFPDKSLATPPSSSGSAHGWKDAGQPVPSITNEPSQAASLVHSLPVPANDALNNLWLNLYGQHFPGESLATHPSLGSGSLGNAQGGMDTEQPVASITNELEHDHGPSDEASAPPVSAHGWMDAGQPVPFMTNEPSQATSPVHSPPIPANDALNNLWLNLYGQPFPDKSLATPPSSPGPAHGWMDAGQPVPSTTNELEHVHGSSDESFAALGPAHGLVDAEHQPIPNGLEYGHDLSDESFAAPGSAHGWVDAEHQSVPNGLEYGHDLSDESFAASGPAHGWVDAEHQSIPNGLEYGHDLSDESFAAPGSAHGWMDAEHQSIPNGLEYGHGLSDESFAASGPAHGWVDAEHQSIPNELEYSHGLSDESFAPPGSAHGWMDAGHQSIPNGLEYGHGLPDESLAAPGPAHGWVDAEHQSIHNGLEYGHGLSYESFAAPGSAHGWMDVEHQSITKEPSQAASPVHSPPVPGNDALNSLWLKLYGQRFPDKSLATPPSSSEPAHDWIDAGQPVPSVTNELEHSHGSSDEPFSAPVSAHGWKDAGQPVPSMTNEPSQVASPDHSLPVPGNDASNNLWLKLDGQHFPGESLATHPSLGSGSFGNAQGGMDTEQPVPSITNELEHSHGSSDEPFSAPVSAHGWKDAGQPVPSMTNEPSQAGSPVHSPPVPGNDALNSLWLKLYGQRFPDKSLATPPSSSGPTHGWMDAGQPVPSMTNEPSRAASPVHSLPFPGNDASNNLWLKPYGQHFPDESLATQPTWGLPSSGHAQGWMDTEQPASSITNEFGYGHGSSDEHFAAPGSTHGWMDAERQSIPNELEYGHGLSDEPFAAPVPAHDWMNAEHQYIPNELEYGHGSSDESFAAPGHALSWMDAGHQYIPDEPSQAAGTVHSLPVPDNDALNNMWLNHYSQHFPESLATHPSWGSLSSGHAHGSMDTEQPVPSINNELGYSHGSSDESFTTPVPAHTWMDAEHQSIPNEPSPAASTVHLLPVPENDASNNLRLDHYGQHFSDKSLATHPSWGPPSSGHTQGWMDTEQLVPSITNELGYGHGLSDESFAAPPWDLPPSGPAHGWIDAGHQVIPNKPSQAASTVHSLPIPGSDALNNMWLTNIYGQHFSTNR